MKIRTLFLLALFANCLLQTANSYSQSLSPKVIASSGGYYVAGGNSLSWTLGETVTATLTAGNNILTQGFQQPEITLVLLNLKAYIQGYYAGGGMMQSVMSNEGYGVNTDETDTLTVELHLANSPNDIAATFKGVLLTNGNLICKFPSSVMGSSCYIVLKSKNTLETWSALPHAFTAATSYDFTTGISQAYQDIFNANPQMYEVEPNVWAIYSGDVNQDQAIDGGDFNTMEPDVTSGAFGYYPTEITGDGPVDGGDFNLLELNVGFGLFVAHP